MTAGQPADPKLVKLVEGLAIEEWERYQEQRKHNRYYRLRHRFFFVKSNYDVDKYWFNPPKGQLQTWFQREFELHRKNWTRSRAVVFSYGAPKSLRFQLVMKDTGYVYCFSVDLRTGQGFWTKVNQELSIEMKRAIKLARR